MATTLDIEDNKESDNKPANKAVSITKSNRQKNFTSDAFTEDERRLIYDNLEKSPSVRRFVSKRGRSSNKTVLIYKTGLCYLSKYLQDKHKDLNIDQAIAKLKRNELDIYETVENFTNFMLHDLNKSPNTAHAALKAVKSLLRSERISLDPKVIAESAGIPKPYKDEGEYALTKETISKILQSAKVRRLRVFLFCLASSGCRLLEMSSIRWKDVNFDSRPTTIHLQPQYTKTRNGRLVFVSDEGTEELKQWHYYKSKENTEKIDPNSLVFQTHRTAREQKINGNSPRHIAHRMTISFASLLKSLGMDAMKDLNNDIDNNVDSDNLDESSSHVNNKHNGRKKYNRLKITMHSLRRHYKTIISMKINPDLAENLIGHRSLSQTYFRADPSDIAKLYYEKCMPLLTFCDMASVEKMKDEKVAELANKDLVLASTQKHIEKIQHDKDKDKEEFMKMIQEDRELFTQEIDSLRKNINNQRIENANKAASAAEMFKNIAEKMPETMEEFYKSMQEHPEVLWRMFQYQVKIGQKAMENVNTKEQ